MGTLLEMRQAGFVLAALLALSGCGNDGGWGEVAPSLRNVFARREPGPDLRTVLTPEFIAAFKQPLMLAELPEYGAQAGVVFASENGASRTWVSPDGISLTFRSGLLTETRGLGGDLMSADLDDVAEGVFGGRAQGLRVHRYLNGEDHLETRAFICDYSRQGGVAATTLAGPFRATHVTENCAGPDIVIENHYWVDGGGQVRKSLQWIGPVPGYVATEVLRDK